MITAQNTATIAKTMYQQFNDRKLDEAKKTVSADCTWTNVSTGETFRGPEGFKQFAQGWIDALPDARVDIQTQIATEEYVVTEFIGRGVHKGPFQTPKGPIPATNKNLNLPFCEILRLRDGKVVEARIYFDKASMMQQLGLA